MEQYQSMAKAIENLKRPIVHIALVSFLTHLAILGTGIYMCQKEDHKQFNTFRTCLFGMNTLFNNNPDEHLFNKNVLKEVKEHSFSVDEIILVKVKGTYHCDVVTKDSKGFRSYLVTLEKNSSFRHLYRILDVKGQKIISKYQRSERI